jgi:hypothetical protein
MYVHVHPTVAAAANTVPSHMIAKASEPVDNLTDNPLSENALSIFLFSPEYTTVARTVAINSTKNVTSERMNMYVGCNVDTVVPTPTIIPRNNSTSPRIIITNMKFVASFASDNSSSSCVGKFKSLVLIKSDVIAATESKKKRG